MGEYAVLFGSERIGTATVTKQGLFYCITCKCRISGSVPVRVRVIGEREVDLGLCVPMGEAFGLKATIPIKSVGSGDLTFFAAAKHRAAQELMIVSADEPFRYIARLKDAYLVKRENGVGITFRTTAESPNPQDSGQNP